MSDFPRLKTIKKYDVENQIGEITRAKRAYYIVDKQGVVRFKRMMTPFDVDGPLSRERSAVSRTEQDQIRRRPHGDERVTTEKCNVTWVGMVSWSIHGSVRCTGWERFHRFVSIHRRGGA